MNNVRVGDRAAMLVALADNMKKFGPAFSRLPSDLQDRERKFSVPSRRELAEQADGFSQSTFDMNRSYGL